MKEVYAKTEDITTLDKCIESNIPVLLVGETGTGKTTLVKEFAKENKKELIRVSLNGNISTEEILGKFLLAKEETVWQDGILTTAVRKGQWIIFDEINSCSPEILFAIHGLLDEEKALVLPEKDNERIPAHKDFRFLASMNPDDYAGTKTLNQAFISRFVIINIQHIAEDNEIKFLINKYKISEAKAKSIVSLGSELRKMKTNQEIDYFCSTRDLEMVAQLLSKLSLENAFKVAVFNKMNALEIEELMTKSPTFAKFIDTHRSTLDYKIERLKATIEEAKKYESKKVEIEKLKIDQERIKKENNLERVGLDAQRVKINETKNDINKIVDEKVKAKIKSLLS